MTRYKGQGEKVDRLGKKGGGDGGEIITKDPGSTGNQTMRLIDMLIDRDKVDR